MAIVSFGRIRETASELLEQHKFVCPPVKVREIAERLGLEVVEMSLPPWFFGVLMQMEGDRYLVVNRLLSAESKNFTIGHELGHFVMHEDALCYMKNSKRPYFHREADVFAAELCMPAEMVTREAELWNYDHVFLAKRFAVTETAMIRRLEELKLIPQGYFNWQYGPSLI